MNSLMKYVLYFTTHWQLDKTLLLPSPVSSLSSPEGSVKCQGKSHLSDICEVRRKWPISYAKGRKKASG